MSTFFYILCAELITILYFLAGFYQREGWFARFSFSIAALLGGLALAVLILLWAARISAEPKTALEQRIRAWFGQASRQKALTGGLAGITLLLFGVCLLPPQDIAARTFALIPLRWVLAGLGLFILQGALALEYGHAPRIRTAFDAAGRFFERYGIFILFALFAVFRVILLTPLIHNFLHDDDSIIYSQMARHFLSGGLSIADFNHYPPLYPFAIQAIFDLNPRLVYGNLLWLNSIYMTGAIFPVYLLAQIFLDKRKSLFFGAASACYPALLFYPGLFMSENLAFPLFFWALYFSFSSPRTGRWLYVWDILAGVSIGLLWLTRYMTISLIPLFLLIWWIKPEPEHPGIRCKPGKAKILRLLLLGGVTLGIYLLWVVPGLLQGVDIKTLLGFFAEGKGSRAPRSFADVLFWSGISLAYLAEMSAPILHLLTGAIRAPAREEDDRRQRAYATLWTIGLWLLGLMLVFVATRHAWQATYNVAEPHRYVARYIIYLTIPLWLSGLIGLQKRNPPARWMIFSSLAALLLVSFSIGYLLKQGWLVSDFLFNGSIDFLAATFNHPLFLIFLAGFIAATCVLTIRNQMRAATWLTIFFLALISLGSWPAFLQELEGKNVYGRGISEVFARILDAPQQSYMLANPDRLELFVPWVPQVYAGELDIRGVDATSVTITRVDLQDVRVNGCKADLILQYDRSETYGLIFGSKCAVVPADEISAYTFFDRSYHLIRMQGLPDSIAQQVQ